jgi:hypothetical protein
MLKLTELKAGDIVLADFEGQMRVGDVLDVSWGDKKALIAHNESEFWYEINNIYAVPLDHDILTELGFSRANGNTTGTVYQRGPFTLEIVDNGQDNHSLLHYRDETRHVHGLKYLHQLQKHYKGMTNFERTWP